MFIDKKTLGWPYRKHCKRVKGGECKDEIPS